MFYYTEWNQENTYMGYASSASDVFLSKNDNFGGKTREASEGVEYDFYFTEYDCCPVWSRVLIFTHCPIKLIYCGN